MKSSPSVSIIILNFNGLEDTIDCVASLTKTIYPNYEITIVDNGSKVNEAKILKQKFLDKKGIKIVRFNKNLGFTGGNNRIVKKIKSKYIVFLNNDTKVEPSWLKQMVNYMEAHKNVAACQSKILLLNDRSRFDYAGGCGGFIDKFGYPFTRGRIFFTSEKNNGQYDSIRKLFWASGAVMMIRRKVFISIGGFDRLFFIYMEEIDLCWRLLQKGFEIASIPNSIVYHKVAASAKKNLFLKKYFEHRNNLIMLIKNYSTSDLFLYFPIRILFEIFTLFFYTFKGNYVFAGALIKAHINFWFLFPKIIKKREKNLKSIGSYSTLVYKRSIVFDYFLIKKQYFSMLGL